MRSDTVGLNVVDLASVGYKLNLFQVEVTNVCNGKCDYCPQPTMRRKKGYMPEHVFRAALDVMENDAFHLHGHGETLMHQGATLFVKLATEAGKQVGFSTNGYLLTQDALDRLADAGLKWLRLHVGPFGRRLSEFKVPQGIIATEHRVGDGPDDVEDKGMTSWGGWMDLGEHGGADRCSFLGYPLGKEWRCLLYDGTVTLCCVDYEGGATQGDLCKACRGFVFRSPRDWGNYDGEGWAFEEEK